MSDNIENKAQSKIELSDINRFRREILDWYDRHRRVLPWRARSGETPDPYHVWLSEVMLQQTVVAAVIPYFLKFTDMWPTIHDLAKADNDAVMKAWAGLGYYARARNLHKCAKYVSQECGGVFPQELSALKSLPGIGDYTAAAIRSIAFGRSAVVVDGNIERVMARFHAVQQPLPDSKKHLKVLTAEMAAGRADRPGDFAQAMMDLGATICTPKSPKCMLCPLHYGCAAYKKGVAASLPRKKPKKRKPEKAGRVYWIENDCAEVLLHKRPESGLLGGTTGLPTSAWLEQGAAVNDLDIVKHGTGNIEIENKNTLVYHSFTHFNLTLECLHVRGLGADVAAHRKVTGQDSGYYYWSKIAEVKISSFPTVFAKCCRLFG